MVKTKIIVRDMMNSKSEMAEWILDFFRNSNSKTGEMVMFPTVMASVSKLNPKEKNLFTVVANELISNGYMTFEQNPIQCVRLTAKGEEYIYNPKAVLDCCIDSRKPTEKVFRNIISLGLIVSTLQSYQDILKRGEIGEDLSFLENPSGDNQSFHQLRIETVKEYYNYLYRFFYSVCQLLCQLDEAGLRDILFNYIKTVCGILKAEISVMRFPMIPELSETYSKAIESVKSEDELENLHLIQSLLFM